MLKPSVLAWAIVDAFTDKLILFDHRTPIYWNRRVAVECAHEHGYATSGSKASAHICRVEIRQWSQKYKRSR